MRCVTGLLFYAIESGRVGGGLNLNKEQTMERCKNTQDVIDAGLVTSEMKRSNILDLYILEWMRVMEATSKHFFRSRDLHRGVPLLLAGLTLAELGDLQMYKDGIDEYDALNQALSDNRLAGYFYERFPSRSDDDRQYFDAGMVETFERNLKRHCYLSDEEYAKAKLVAQYTTLMLASNTTGAGFIWYTARSSAHTETAAQS